MDRLEADTHLVTSKTINDLAKRYPAGPQQDLIMGPHEPSPEIDACVRATYERLLRIQARVAQGQAMTETKATKTALGQEEAFASISGASPDIGLVVRQSDFLEALESPEVQETLACADAIRRSADFPPDRHIPG